MAEWTKAWAAALALGVSALAPLAADAGFTSTSQINSTTRRKLENNTIHVVVGDYTVKANAGFSAFYMDDNSTAVLYIPSGRTLTLKGGKASGTSGAGAGIEVPSSSTLVITGGGTLKVTGGAGANGSGGSGATDAICDDDDIKGGWGGAGGAGGGGAGAGIGGKGGSAGSGGSRPGEPPKQPASRWSSDMHDTSGNSGNSGTAGSSGTAGGTVYVLGTVTVEASSGAKGSGGNGGGRGNSAWYSETWEYHAGYGGGGGGGGGGGSAKSIGGGGGGGGGGGSGGNGGHYWTSRGGNPSVPDGGGGSGGKGNTSNDGGNGGGTRGSYGSTNGGWGGGSGACGGVGSSGSLYADSGVSLSAPGRLTSSAGTHSAIEYTLAFDDDWRVTSNATVRFGYALPKAPATSRYGYTFRGWYSGAGGTGAQYYDASGNSLRADWSDAHDVTLYPKWERNTAEDLANVTLWVNGTEVLEGVDASGDGWNYSSENGRIYLTGAGKTYDVKGKDYAGFAQITPKCDCTLQVSDELEMQPYEKNPRKGYVPVDIEQGRKVTFVISQPDASCSLMGASGCTAIRVPSASSLTLKTEGVLYATGGDGAADIGVSADDPEGGLVYVETYSNWAANIWPGHGYDDGNGLFNSSGRGARFRSLATSNTVWSVRLSDIDTPLAYKKMYLQRVPADIHDDVFPDLYGTSWVWMPEGRYEWATELNATIKSNNLWVCKVAGTHCAAEFYTPLHIEIDGVDIAHLAGDGWYADRIAASEGSRAVLVVTNAGPHTVTGYGNASIEIARDTSLTVSNLQLHAASWEGKTALLLHEGVKLGLTVQGETNKFTSASGRAGIFVGASNSLTIDGDGLMTVVGGKNAAGIGGSNESESRRRNGEITISSGTITASGGANAAGIGSAQGATGNGAIKIDGGVVVAYGGQYAAAVGGGNGAAGNVTIVHGTVFPTAGTKAYAIGCGYNGSSSIGNEFGFAAIYTDSGKVHPSAKNIDGHNVFPVSFDTGLPNCQVTNLVVNSETKECRDVWTNEKGYLTLWLEPTNEVNSVTVAIVDGDGGTTQKSWGYTMDGEGNYEFSNDVLTIDETPVIGGQDNSGSGWSYSKASKALVVKTGAHTIGGSSTNGTIRVVVTGNGLAITLKDMTLETSKSELSPFVVSGSCTLTLVGENKIECHYNANAYYKDDLTSQFTAAVEVPSGASLTIDGYGSLTAKAGPWGAGIGSRGATTTGGSLDAGTITINSGFIYATGGSGHKGNYEGGAGIGGGKGGGVAAVVVNGGYVNAVGGRGACGIGGGAGKNVTITNGAIRVTGGTVLVEGGDGSSSDLATGIGNTFDVTMGKPIVIDGGSVRPRNAGLNRFNPSPNPVNSNGVRLAYAMILGLGESETVHISDPIWTQYDGVELIADEDGALCLWGENTNVVRAVMVESPNIDGGSCTFDLCAGTNTIQSTSAGGESPDSRKIDGETCWRVEVHALPRGQRMTLTGIDSAYSRASRLSDNAGKLYLYLPDGDYDFRVDSYSYHASVAGAPTVATYKVGLLVGGVDIGTESGGGWTYDGTEETLTLTGAREYLISGTNTDRRVSVCVAASGVKVRADRLSLAAANMGAFYIKDGSGGSLEFVGGTMSTGSIKDKVAVSGGSLDADFRKVVAYTNGTQYADAYRLTVGGLTRNGYVEIENIEGLEGYDTSGIWANDYGEVYLYLPDDRDYYFRVRDGETTTEMIAFIDGADATAINFTPTGVYINGRDAARLRGKYKEWTSEDGEVSLLVATNYVVTGTNDGPAVTIKSDKSQTTLTLVNLVMTNEFMNASPISVGSDGGLVTHFTVELSGTNVLKGVRSDACGLRMRANTDLAISGDGYLDARGGDDAPGVGTVGSDLINTALKVLSGEIVATGGDRAAGIGGGAGLDGFKVYVYGGKVTAYGGQYGAGIGGGSGAGALLFTITNGMVNAYGGEGADGIGKGRNGSVSGYFEGKGGTLVAKGGSGGSDISALAPLVTGGSLHALSDGVSGAKNASSESVYCVTIPTGRPNFDVGAVMSDYNGYLLTGVVTDDDGKIYIWLPDGKYYLSIGGVPYRAVVNGDNTTAEVWYTGVQVNGVDAALQSGAGWAYDPFGHTLALAVGEYVVSGTNTSGEVFLYCMDNGSITVSNLVLATSEERSPVEVCSNKSVKVTLVGSSSFTSRGEGVPAVHVPETASLSITNIDYVVSVPEPDNVYVYTNTLYDIELDENDNPVIGQDGNVITNGVYYDIITVTNCHDEVKKSSMSATGGKYAAGIGGGRMESYGTIEIYDGAVTAQGGESAAGIGSGCLDESQGNKTSVALSGTLKIYGGTVSATGRTASSSERGGGAGLGGGSYHTGGTITISGGDVTANGGATAAGIGAGYYARANAIAISGGTVNATGGLHGGAGIGGGSDGKGIDGYDQYRTVTISGGVVTAVGGEPGAAGIGAGEYDRAGMKVTISGGTVFATGGEKYGLDFDGDDIGTGGYNTTLGVPTLSLQPLTIRGASVYAARHTNSSLYMAPAPSNGTERVYCVTVQTDSTNDFVRVQHLEGYGDDSRLYADREGKVYLWLPNGTYVFYVGNLPLKATVNGADTTAQEWLTGVKANGKDVSYAVDESRTWAYDLGDKTLYIKGDCTVSGANTEGLVSISVSTTDELSFTISNLYLKLKSSTKASPIAVKGGTVTICLAGTNKLDATETDSFAGLNIVSPATLVITNLEENARLEAYSGEDAAAIGGNQNKEDGVDYTTGTICIRGGNIYAQAKDSGAGIGSGYRGRSGDISISGGRVEAHGGEYYGIGGTWCGAGIGGGDSATVSTGCKIAISGGTVEAYGGIRNDRYYAADIGAGYSDNSEYRIVISGGSVHPESDDATRSFTQRWGSQTVVPRNNDYNPVYKVTLDDCVPNAKADIELDGYGSNDIWADSSGKVYLWLATGSYSMKRDGKRYTVTVDSSGNYTIELAPIGVEVDGVDVKARSGAGWTYDVNTCTLAITGDCTLSGTNVYDVIMCRINSNATVTFSDLCLTTATNSPVMVAAGVTARVLLAGTNTLACALSQYNDYSNRLAGAGLRVPVGATLRMASKTGYVDGVLYAQGGVCSAGIGGILQDSGVGGAAGTIVIESGRIYATGGNYGAGIGGGRQGDGGTITVSGGIVTATVAAGSYASAIGGGMGAYAAPPAYTQSGGTVLAYGSQSGVGGATNPSNVDLSGSSIIVSGGSLLALGNKATSLAVTNGTGEAVYCVTVSNLTAGAEVTVTGLAGYGKDGIYADDDGCIHLWLPEGVHNMGVNGKRYVATVASDGSSTVELDKVGVSADGIDVANGYGPGWSYDFDAGVLVVSDGVTLSGTNTEGKVSVVAATEDAFALTISNLCLSVNAINAKSPIAVTNGTVTICLAGTNTIDVLGESSFATAIGVGPAASLVLTNLEECAYLEATGSGNHPAIGGYVIGNIGNITIAGGTIVANGGFRAAAIGLTNANEVPAEEPRTIRITGGRVYAVASGASGNYGAGIGGASQTKVHGLTVSIEGGTVSATGPLTGGGSHGADIGNGQLLSSGLQGEVTIRITGGSVITNAFGFTATGDTEQYSVNALGETNWCAKVSGFAANERADIELDGYGTNDIYADADGNVWLWLADGVYLYTTGAERHALKMEGGTATIADVPDSYGVQVDGGEVAQLSGGAWDFDPFANVLSLSGDVALSGTNTAGEVKIVADADVTISPSRLVLGVGSGEDVLSGAGIVTITNGTAQLTGNVACPLKILGGSFKFDGLSSFAVSNETAALFCVMVQDLTPNAAVAFTGLPTYYGTSGIYADDEGKVYLWLSAEWDTSSIAPHYLSAARRLRAGATHSFAANGYNYTVTIDPDEGGAVAEKGAALELEGFQINDFVVEGDVLAINVTAKPDTWLNGFFDSVVIRASSSLPIAKTPDTVLDTSAATVTLEADGSATYVVPLPPCDGASRFFTVDRRNDGE